MKSYSPNTIARNIKHRGKGVLSIRRYHDGNLREVALLLLFICLFFVGKDFILQKNMFYNAFRNVKSLINIELEVETQWEYDEDINNKGYAIGGMEESAYKRFVYKAIKNNGKSALVTLSFPLLLFLLAGYPRFRPLRIDAKRRLVYFWSSGEFYVTRLPMLTETRYPPQSVNYLQPRPFKPAFRPVGQEALLLHIPHETDSKRSVAVDLGIFRPTAKDQYLQLEAFLNDFLASDNPEEKYAHYFKRESWIISDLFNLFYQFRLFPSWGYNEKKTEAKIQAFLARETN